MIGCISSVGWSLSENEVTSCEYDVTPLPWQRDNESMTTTLQRAVIPTVVESERVTDDDECDKSAAVAGARQRRVLYDTISCAQTLTCIRWHWHNLTCYTWGHGCNSRGDRWDITPLFGLGT